MSESGDAGLWGSLGLAGAVGLCCTGTATLAGGAALAGGSAVGVTAASNTIGGLGGILVTGLATALPLFVIGVVLRRRGRHA